MRKQDNIGRPIWQRGQSQANGGATSTLVSLSSPSHACHLPIRKGVRLAHYPQEGTRTFPPGLCLRARSRASVLVAPVPLNLTRPCLNRRCSSSSLILLLMLRSVSVLLLLHRTAPQLHRTLPDCIFGIPRVAQPDNTQSGIDQHATPAPHGRFQRNSIADPH